MRLMIRVAMLAGGFLVISPNLRAMCMSVLDQVAFQINQHSVLAMILMGLICFASFFSLQVWTRRRNLVTTEHPGPASREFSSIRKAAQSKSKIQMDSMGELAMRLRKSH